MADSSWLEFLVSRRNYLHATYEDFLDMLLDAYFDWLEEFTRESIHHGTYQHGEMHSPLDYGGENLTATSLLIGGRGKFSVGPFQLKSSSTNWRRYNLTFCIVLSFFV